MKFRRPVAEEFPISAHYGDWGPFWSKHIDASGVWVNCQSDGMGQHKGIDFKTPEGTLVYAMEDGLIIASGWENPSNPKQGFGLRVRQQFLLPSGVYATIVYGHLQATHVQTGHQIVKGDRIGFSGKTGHVTGPHLHVEVVDGRGQYHPLELDTTERPPDTIVA